MRIPSILNRKRWAPRLCGASTVLRDICPDKAMPEWTELSARLGSPGSGLGALRLVLIRLAALLFLFDFVLLVGLGQRHGLPRGYEAETLTISPDNLPITLVFCWSDPADYVGVDDLAVVEHYEACHAFVP
ncbi:hypothetical protein B1812_16640 [Methylocystis bryophila]|uniref:Uncharacterized protein n=1 Tax=Methylocystis bryophila TaxID=655015 RepID=A0A1W6MXW8_9HYPH|nr:hypothetical protein B1812_16640 [Methylocystis bryophila]